MWCSWSRLTVRWKVKVAVIMSLLKPASPDGEICTPNNQNHFQKQCRHTNTSAHPHLAPAATCACDKQLCSSRPLPQPYPLTWRGCLDCSCLGTVFPQLQIDMQVGVRFPGHVVPGYDVPQNDINQLTQLSALTSLKHLDLGAQHSSARRLSLSSVRAHAYASAMSSSTASVGSI
jgi:hypothetical protein